MTKLIVRGSRVLDFNYRSRRCAKLCCTLAIIALLCAPLQVSNAPQPQMQP